MIEKAEDEILARDSDITHPLLAERLSSDSSRAQENPSKPGNLRICFAC